MTDDDLMVYFADSPPELQPISVIGIKFIIWGRNIKLICFYILILEEYSFRPSFLGLLKNIGIEIIHIFLIRIFLSLFVGMRTVSIT